MFISYSSRFIYELPQGHHFPIEKYALIREQLEYEGTATSQDLHDPGLCDDQDVCLAHSTEYWERLRNFQLTDRELRKIGVPVYEVSVNRVRNSVNGTIKAAYKALEEGIAFNLGGGTHHAFFDHGEAYSMVNDLAIAAQKLLHEREVERLLILDLDVHQGNGTAAIFQQESRVFTASVHCEANYPLRKEVSDIDLSLSAGTGDTEYLGRLEDLLADAIDRAHPDLILYQAGVDILGTDRLGKLDLSKDGCKERDRLVFQQAFRKGIPITVTMGGGYSPRIADIVDAHTNTFREGLKIFEEVNADIQKT